MDKRAIENVIKAALVEDQGAFVAAIRNGLGITDKTELGRAVTYVLGFIALIPNLLESVATSTFGRELSIESSPFMRAIEQYFLNPDDIIPSMQFPGALGLIDDAYYAITLLQALKEALPENEVLPELDLNYARRVFVNIMGKELARSIEAKVVEDLGHLNQERQYELRNNVSSVCASDVGNHLERVKSSFFSNQYSMLDITDTSDWYGFQSSDYETRDPFEEDSAGWPGGAYQNPNSNWYSPNDDY
jgi:uncharacterized membrane protein YkvA (DUF1232 family)